MESCEDKNQQHSNVDSGSNIRKTNFEEAVTKAGWGAFHFFLYVFIIPALWATNFDTSTSSLIAPAAECDFQLTLLQKGALNAAVYGGMVSSGLLWGFVADSFGRKPIIVYGYLLDGLFNICSGLSQNFYVLLIFKLLCGLIISGPHAATIAYCAEFHCTKSRPTIAMIVGFFLTSGIIVSAALALLIIPQQWHFTFVNLEIRSWQIYLITCGLIVLCAALGLAFFPESPKFLMSQGRNEEALEVFRKIYSINSCRTKNNYPVRVLEIENSMEFKNRHFKNNIQDGLMQMKSLFSGSYLPKLLVIVTIQFCAVLCDNTIRLWQPQLFAFMAESTSQVDDPLNFCQIIDNSTLPSVSNMGNGSENCAFKAVDSSMYVNVIIISSMTLILSFIAGLMVNVIKSKYLLLICFCMALCSGLAINWSTNIVLTLALISVFVGSLRAANNLVVSLVLILFPTRMRTMAVSLTMMFGRFGSVIGNMLFPILLQYGCSVAILSLISLVLVAFALTLFIPRSVKDVH